MLVFIDRLARRIFFIAAATWRGASAREFEPLCFLLNRLAIAKFTKQANDNKQSSRW
jgi:hypothetical protein